MRLNDLNPGKGRKAARRVGRGTGSGSGKTCGRGHKGQRSRSGPSVMIGFEGGQMPLHRRLPKFGFVSRQAPFNGELRLERLGRVEAEVVDLDVLRAAGLVGKRVKRLKVIAGGTLDKAVTLRGIAVSKGARAAIEAAGGKVEEA